MNGKPRYGLYGLTLAGAAGVALWAGLPPFFLLILLVCPLMMFVMMRGMRGGQDNQQGRSANRSDESVRPMDAAERETR